jgi:hypothetical protein
MAVPVKFTVTSGRVDRASVDFHHAFFPTFTVVYADGSKELGPWLLFRQRVGEPRLSSDRVQFINGGFRRRPDALDGPVRCRWTFSEAVSSSRRRRPSRSSASPARWPPRTCS